MPTRPFRAASRSLLAIVLAAGPIALWPGAGLGQSCLCGSIADDLVAAAVGLDREWVVQVPFDSAGWRLSQVVVGERLVVAQGGDGTVAAIRTDTRPGAARRGSVAWSAQVGGSGPIEAAGIGSRLVTVARGRSVTALDAGSGQTRWQLPIAGMASAGAMPAGGWVYTPLDGDGVFRLPEDRWAEATAPADGARDPEGLRPGERTVPLTLSSKGEVDFPLVASDNGVLWCNARGLITVLQREDDSTRQFEFDLGGPASGAPVVRDGDIFVATTAGDVVRIARSPVGLVAYAGVGRDSRGQNVAFNGWHTVVEAVPEGSPLVGQDTVVVSLGPSGLAAFSATTGQLKWQVEQGATPLAITDDRVWCLDDAGFLTARDLASGGRRERFCLGCFSVPVVNTISERLVLASPGGLVVSLAPRRTTPAIPPVPPQPEPPGPAAAPADPDAGDDADEV
jgi:outer membrane protein assembly factor BamB